MQLNKDFDIVVFGFGIVSKLFLTSICKLNIKTAVINRKPKSYAHKSIKRGIALNYSSCQYLKNTGMINNIELYGNKIKKILISEKNLPNKIGLSSSDINSKYLSYVVEESSLEKIFLSSINYNNTYFFNNYVLHKIKKLNSGWLIFIKKKKKIILLKTKLLIGIDGTNSCIKKLLKIKNIIHKYDSVAYIFNCYIKKKNKKIAYQKIFNKGIIACLPLKQNIMKVVITTSNEEKVYLDSINSNRLKLYLQYIINENIGEIKKITKAVCYGLIGVKSTEVIKKDLLFLGNAAITLNPITAQGFNLCVKDIFKFNDIIKKSMYQGNIKISYNNLLYYQLIRHHEHNLIFKNINLIYYFFKTNYLFPFYLRNFFFFIFKNSIYLKKKFILYKQGVLID